MASEIEVQVARAICAAQGKDFDKEAPNLETLRRWRHDEGADFDLDLQTQQDWIRCARAAIEAYEAARAED